MKKKIVSERTVARHLVKVLQSAGYMVVKNHPCSTNNGIPDYVAHNSRTFYVETKTTGCECTSQQIEYQKELKRHGIDTYVVDFKVENVNDIFEYGYTEYEGRHFRKNPFQSKRNPKI